MINVWNIFICCLLLTSSCRQETNGDNKVKNENTDSISNEKEEVEPVVTEKQVKRQDVDVVRKDIYDEVVEKEARNIYRHASSIVDYYYSDNGELKRIETTYEGDRECLKSEYFFQDSITTVRKVSQIYDPPKWEDTSKIKTSDTVTYKLKNKELVAWSVNGEPVAESQEYKQKETQLLKEIEQYRELEDNK